MSVRRFRIWFEDDGQTVEFACAAWPTLEEREEALSGSPAGAQGPEDAEIYPEPRPRGRPSFDQVIGAALESLGDLDGLGTRAARVRSVLREIARRCADPTQIPSRDTVERYLRDSEGQKARQNSPQKSRSGKVASTGD